MASSETRNTTAQSNLHQQDLSKLDVTKLSALSPEVISRQATINIGTIGHVAHGKSTVVKAISGVQTVRFKNELERNITIKLERLSDTFIKVYSERADEKQEQSFFEKLIRPRKRNHSPEPQEKDSPPAKKSKQKVQEYIIEAIHDMKMLSGTVYFYVKWKGYTEDDNTWEPVENLDNCPLILKEFLAKLELKYCEQIEKLTDELSFDNLLEEKKIVKRFCELEKNDFDKMKQNLLITLISMITLSEDEEKNISDLVEKARDELQLYICAKRRCRQLMALRNWEEHLNQVDKCKKLLVENIADLAGPPENFTYINQSIPGAGVTIPDEPPIGCECTACNCRSKSCCGNQGGIFAYTVNKRLRVATGTPVYECNKACKCSTDCSNRVVQNGRFVKLCIFRTFNGCGWSVRTEQKIRQGQFVCTYTGEVITFEEAEKRGREYDANGLTYLFDLDFNSVENPYTIDAAHMGNVSHFINHSCNPNLGVWAVWADCLDPNLPMLALFATRDIEAGEEICFDYLQKGTDAEVVPGPSSQSPSSEVRNAEGIEATIPSDIELSPSKRELEIQQGNGNTRYRTECKCGAFNCRKYLF